MINIRTNKKTLVFIIALVFLAIILLFLKIASKEKPLPLPQPETNTPTPIALSPTLPPSCPLESSVEAKLPVVTKNYSIEYLPVPQKFFVLIFGEPFERYRAEVEKWFTSYGIDPRGPCVSWASPRVP